MNKQEAIKELESHKMIGTDARSACYNEAIKAGILVIKKLDEPQKQVVPKFVAEYLNYCMANEWTLGEALTTGKFQFPEYLYKAVDWLNDSMNQNIFAQAWLFGYEVEKEPLYRVRLGEGYFVEYQGRGALIIPDDNKEIKVFDSKSDAERTAQTIGGTVEEVAEG
ncbi:DUF1642 domain-containing protein [Enterococcus hirae]|uniref:DUF1642 domain-containing protein n=1 Tax=Enterococcus TaxID=1350 RepID=UPI0009BDB181|nr:DUF1642 domain-containing protein [Enterococcus hirae]EMF0125419.1 DUF1642 domain-containing protein [Enterococcus hirae]EMF0161711.1 DUF1642 domain-containing protein [Enterococcus hirae]MEB5877658.1 DUF1642 domain-containing protein [Enterococcus hirae]MEB5904644.1 DUF1642 domain-containing protein [Enterococcus hirae]OQO46899.1 hypothetical protein BH737_02560 [Enterococcus hirae]